MTTMSVPGTRPETLPLVQVTSPQRRSSACRAHTSAFISSTAAVVLKVMSLPRSCSGVVLWSLRGLVGDLVELVQGSGAAAAEVVVEFGVDRVQLVVGVGAGLVREVGGPFDLAHRLGG